MATVSIANFQLLADFFQLEAESPEEARMQSEDLEILLDVLYEEASPVGQGNYDQAIETRDPTTMPWAALHAPEGEFIPVFYLLLDRRDDLVGDALNGPWVLDWRSVYDLANQMRAGWRPTLWTPLGEDPYVDPYANDPATDVLLDEDSTPTPTEGAQPKPRTPPVVREQPVDELAKAERDMLLIGGGIAAAIVGGIWLTTSLLKA